MTAVTFQGGLCHWTLSANGHSIERRRSSVIASDSEQVLHLCLRRDQKRVDRLGIERVKQAEDRCGINRSIPNIWRQLEDFCAAIAQGAAELWVRLAVQLNGNRSTLQVEMRE